MRIIVTGGLGFIGSNFVNHIIETTTHSVLIVDKLTYAGNIKNIKHDVSLLQKDICDVTPEDLGEYDYLVHFAAESHVDNSISNGLPFVKTNVEGTFNLIECAKKNPNLKKFIHISTDEVYGDMNDISETHTATETDNLNPSSYYSSTKASSDLLVLSANRTFGFPYLITRTCNNYGENQHSEKFLPKIYRSIQDGVEVPVYGDGGQVREWIYVKDNVKVICDLMFDDEVINTIYNIGSGIRYTNNDIIRLISLILNKDVKYKFVEDRLGHDRAYRLNCNKIDKYYETKKDDYRFNHLTDFLQGWYDQTNNG
jgi:dTDP-glucose 4,6-dehydratase